MSQLQFFSYKKSLELERGGVLHGCKIAYHTFGTLNAKKDNVVWICHALTANSNAEEWWEGLVGAGKIIDTQKYFVVCANVLGSNYGTTNPLNINPITNTPYHHSFPEFTIRDIVQTLEDLRLHLKIPTINTLIGGSLGGQQALEWAIAQPQKIKRLVLLATNARHSAWGIAFNESQRLAIAADATWNTDAPDAGAQGLKAARSIALLSYRNYAMYEKTQAECDNEFRNSYRASNYQNYQGEKLVNRFNAYSYWHLSRAMDSHNVGRGRKSVAAALNSIRASTLVIGISSDLLFPPQEQIFLAENIPNARFELIDSEYGHDGFLTESTKITQLLTNFFTQTTSINQTI